MFDFNTLYKFAKETTYCNEVELINNSFIADEEMINIIHNIAIKNGSTVFLKIEVESLAGYLAVIQLNFDSLSDAIHGLDKLTSIILQ